MIRLTDSVVHCLLGCSRFTFRRFPFPRPDDAPRFSALGPRRGVRHSFSTRLLDSHGAAGSGGRRQRGTIAAGPTFLCRLRRANSSEGLQVPSLLVVAERVAVLRQQFYGLSVFATVASIVALLVSAWGSIWPPDSKLDARVVAVSVGTIHSLRIILLGTPDRAGPARVSLLPDSERSESGCPIPNIQG